MFDHHLVESLVIAVGDQLLRAGFRKGTDLVEQAQKRPPAVVEVIEPMFHASRAEGMDIEADIFAIGAVVVAFENAHMIESGAKIVASKWFVLVELQAVLIVQMERPKFAERHGKIDFIRRIKTGENAMGRFDQRASAFGSARELGNSESVADGWDIGMVHRFIRLGLDCQTN